MNRSNRRSTLSHPFVTLSMMGTGFAKRIHGKVSVLKNHKNNRKSMKQIYKIRLKLRFKYDSLPFVSSMKT